MHIDKRYFYCGGGDIIGKSFSILRYGNYNFGIDFGGGYGSTIEEPLCPNGIGNLDSLFLTHAHYDHNGMVPCLTIGNPKMVIFCTAPTFDISMHQWEQTLRIQGQDAPFSSADIEAVKRQVQIVSNGTEIKLKPGLSVFPQDSGHILGSSSLLIKNGNSHLTFYTSDICFQNRHLIKGASMPDYNVDLLVREFTYGTSKFEERKDVIARFVSSIREKLNMGAKILIPALSVDRLQDIYAILQEAGIPAYLDCSPVINQIYAKYLGKNAEFLLQAQKIEGRREREDLLRSRKGFVVIASSGMINNSTISSWWAERLLPNKNNAILTVNYMDPGSPGGELMLTPQGRYMVFNGVTTVRNCIIESFNFSAHMSGSDGEMLERKLNPKTIIYGHFGSRDNVNFYVNGKRDRKKRVVAEAGKWEEI